MGMDKQKWERSKTNGKTKQHGKLFHFPELEQNANLFFCKNEANNNNISNNKNRTFLLTSVKIELICYFCTVTTGLSHRRLHFPRAGGQTDKRTDRGTDPPPCLPSGVWSVIFLLKTIHLFLHTSYVDR